MLLRILGCKPFQFVIFGLLIFLARNLWFIESQPLAEIRSPRPAVLEKLKSSWLRQTGRMPDEEEMRVLIQREIDDELLFQEALRRKYHLADTVVRQRLLRNMRFIDSKDPRNDEALLIDAIKLDMHLTDLVVHRRLVQMMEMLLQRDTSSKPVTESEKMQVYKANPEVYTSPVQISLSQVFFSQDKRRNTLEEDAASTLRMIKKQNLPPLEAVLLGDQFLSGHHMSLQSERQIGNNFGYNFASDVMRLDIGKWSDPVKSSYGLHLVWIQQRISAQALDPLDSRVARKLEQEVVRIRKKEQLDRNIAILREKYRIEI